MVAAVCAVCAVFHRLIGISSFPLECIRGLPAPPALAPGLVRLQIPGADVGGHRAPGGYRNALRFGPGAYLPLAGPGVRVLTVRAGGRWVPRGTRRVGAGP